MSPKRIRQIIHATSQNLVGFKIDPKDLRKYSIQNKLKIKDVKDVKNESGLKRLDKRKYLSKEQLLELAKELLEVEAL
jgi:5S rRNA maturation endonuclease (ribonuclease M5)